MKALIPAAGKGKRMLPLTEYCPKALLPIDETNTILDLLVKNCMRAKEIDEIIIAVNCEQYHYFEMWNEYEKVTFYISSIEDNVIKCLSQIINDIEGEDILIAAADNVIEFEIQSFVNFYNEDINKFAVMYYMEDTIQELRRTGVALVEEGLVVAMEEKPRSPKFRYAIPPFYIIPKGQLESISRFLKSGIKVDSLGTYLSWYVCESEVRAFLMPGKRYNLGDKEAYLKYRLSRGKERDNNDY